MNKILSIFIFILIPFGLSSQDQVFRSVHEEQNEYYNNSGLLSITDFDSVNQFVVISAANKTKNLQLNKRIFGYHPYWGGSNYLNYQWDLLSDFCHFSYEVDPGSGQPTTTHSWDTSDAIDSALANNVNVHLCVTLFSGHSTFFTNPTAQQTLIDNIITMVESRDAKGVNMDVEALPSAYGEEYTAFMISLCDQIHTTLPGSEVSIASPAVNWSGTLEIEVLKDYIDFFMVMGYDYYWNGSSQAGAVAPLYSMVGNYDYNFSKTISYYQSQGVPNEKLVIGVPYYAREWETEGQYAPSNTTGNGDAHTFSYVQNNTSGNYSSENKHFEDNSFAPYYSFNSGGWKQCFIDDIYSMGKKYDIVNRRGLAGIGIWALGYDNGYIELWELIGSKFTEDEEYILSDTIFDTGGPAFNYYNYETYTYTITAPVEKLIELTFNYLDLEPVYDSLWIYDGPDVSYDQIIAFSGNSNPITILSTGNHLTMKFFSDLGITDSGWEAIYEVVNSTEVSEYPTEKDQADFVVYPNPFRDELEISFFLTEHSNVEIGIYNTTGSIVTRMQYDDCLPGQNKISLERKLVSSFTAATYFIYLKIDEEIISGKVIVKE